MHAVCSNKFVRSKEVEPAATVKRHLTSYATGPRVDPKRGYVAVSYTHLTLPTIYSV